MAKPVDHATRAIAAIRHASSEVGMPLRFRTDINHDEQSIRRRETEARQGVEADLVFGWAVGPEGTYFSWATGFGVKATGTRYFSCVQETFEGCRYFWWDGWALYEVADGRALDRQLTEVAQAARQKAAS